MRLIALDFDGVIVTRPHAEEMWKAGHPLGTSVYLQPELIALVDLIAKATGAKVLLTTAWQTHIRPEKLTQMLVERGLKAEVVDAVGTRSTHAGYDSRYQQTNNWLVRNRESVESVVILDDEPSKWNMLFLGAVGQTESSIFSARYDAGNGLVAPSPPGWLKGKIIPTSWERGLLPEHVKLAVEILLDSERGGVLPRTNV
jgi:hypothetical protein